MHKAYLFDIDGVLLHHTKWFYEEFSKGYSASAINVLKKYCEGKDIVRCDRGEADTYEVIEPYLREIGYSGSIDAFYDMKNSFESNGIDWIALKKIKQIRELGAQCFIGSNQDHRRKEHLLKSMGLKEIVNEAYFSCDFGYVKPEREYWENVHKRIARKIEGIQAKEIVFFDDREENIESAREYGFISIAIENRDKIHKELDKILS